MNIHDRLLELATAEAKKFDSGVIRRPHLLSVLCIHFFEDFSLADAARKLSLALAGQPPFSGELQISDRARVFLERCTDEDSLRSVFLDLQGSMFRNEASDVAAAEDLTGADSRSVDESDEEDMPAETFEGIMQELESMIGLTAVKEQIRSVTAMHQVNLRRVTEGLSPVDVTHHLVFTGDPGTGKTTVARLVSRLYRTLGLLPSGHMIEVQRGDLVAQYVGQTAPRVQAVIDRALGGILFIDEAYSLSRKDAHANDFGHEAVATLLKAMEDRRGEFAVIVAGYTNEMRDFIGSNPGLQSRFSTTIEFLNYSPLELLAVFDKVCADNTITYNSDVRSDLLSHICETNTGGSTGNARYIRTIFERMFANMSVRIVSDGNITASKLGHFTSADLPNFGDPQVAESLKQKFGFAPSA
jgi:SpoVK/Ycf46/Vps4 family AAA+-type ATPase